MRRLLRLLPLPVRARLRRLRYRLRSAWYHLRERVRPVRVGAGDFERAFRELGVGEGDLVFAQAQMSSFGTIEEGPKAVIEALRRVVGEAGTIVMPSFPLAGLSIDHVRTHPVFDVRSEPSRMGAISEAFRRMPGALRSVHPTHPVCAQGPGAAEIVAGHAEAENPLGPGTPFERLVERGAKNLLMGTSVKPLTAYHMFESLREPPFPYRVFHTERLPVRVIDADGRETDITTMVHEPSLAPGRIDFQPWIEQRMRDRLDEDGMRAARVGRGEILCQTLPGMFATFERMLERDETIYHPDHLRGLRLA